MRKVLEKFVWHFHDVFGKVEKGSWKRKEGYIFYCIYVRLSMEQEIIILRLRREACAERMLSWIIGENNILLN